MPLFAGAVQHLRPVVLARPGASAISPVPSGEPSSTTRIAEALRRGALRSTAPAASHDRLDVLGLVVGGQDQPGLAGHAAAYPRASDDLRPAGATPGALGWTMADRDRRTRRSPTPSTSSATCTSSTARSSTASLAYRTAAKACARPRCRSRRSRARAARPSCRGSARRCRRRSSRCSRPARSPPPRSCARSSRPGLVAITRLPGLGPKRARLLHSELGIDSLEALREAARGRAPAHGARASARSSRRACSRRSTAGARRARPRRACCCPGARRSARRSSPALLAERPARTTHVAARRLGAALRRQRQGHRHDRR